MQQTLLRPGYTRAIPAGDLALLDQPQGHAPPPGPGLTITAPGSSRGARLTRRPDTRGQQTLLPRHSNPANAPDAPARHPPAPPASGRGGVMHGAGNRLGQGLIARGLVIPSAPCGLTCCNWPPSSRTISSSATNLVEHVPVRPALARAASARRPKCARSGKLGCAPAPRHARKAARAVSRMVRASPHTSHRQYWQN